jgi:hypothetical protein
MKTDCTQVAYPGLEKKRDIVDCRRYGQLGGQAGASSLVTDAMLLFPALLFPGIDVSSANPTVKIVATKLARCFFSLSSLLPCIG